MIDFLRNLFIAHFDIYKKCCELVMLKCAMAEKIFKNNKRNLENLERKLKQAILKHENNVQYLFDKSGNDMSNSFVSKR